MNNLVIPTTVVDGFFNDPDAIREFALKQEFFTDPELRWPGKRSKLLHEIDPQLFRYIHHKLLNMFYPDGMNTPYLYVATSQFQLIDDNYKAGWTHYDEELITIIIYLNKNPNKEAGTIICSQKIEGHNEPYYGDKKSALFNGDITEEEGGFYREVSNSRFQDEIIVKNKYNRMLAFDSHLPHVVKDFSNDESRLTLVSFINKLDVKHYPIHNMHRTHQ